MTTSTSATNRQLSVQAAVLTCTLLLAACGRGTRTNTAANPPPPRPVVLAATSPCPTIYPRAVIGWHSPNEAHRTLVPPGATVMHGCRYHGLLAKSPLVGSSTVTNRATIDTIQTAFSHFYKQTGAIACTSASGHPTSVVLVFLFPHSHSTVAVESIFDCPLAATNGFITRIDEQQLFLPGEGIVGVINKAVPVHPG